MKSTRKHSRSGGLRVFSLRKGSRKKARGAPAFGELDWKNPGKNDKIFKLLLN